MDRVHKIPCVKSYEKHMIEANRAYWADSSPEAQGEDWICVYHAWTDDLRFDLYESLVAKGLETREKLPIMSISRSNGSCCRLTDELDDSFGIKRRFYVTLNEGKSRLANLKTALIAQYFTCATYGKKEKLFRAKYRGIAWGDRVHDTIVQENAGVTQGQAFDCFAVSRATYFKYIRNALSIIDQAYAIFKKRRPAYLVTSENLQMYGLLGDVAGRLGATRLICAAPGSGWNNIIQIAPGKETLLGDMVRRQIEDYLRAHPIKAVDDNLFMVKTGTASGQNLAEQLGLDPKKKNAFIFPHILSDVPRENSRHVVYSEYNEWLVDTLKIIREIPNVNWIIKDHPMAAYYKQDGYVKSLFQQYKTDNMYWCDKAVSGLQIKEIADCAITCSGDIGLEYWAYGIPTITTSKGYFCQWGVSYQMKTLSEYKDTLRHIEELPPPPPESVELARRCLTAMRLTGETDDGLTRLFQKAGSAFWTACIKGSTDTTRTDYAFCKQYMALLRGTGVRDSSIYRLENICSIS